MNRAARRLSRTPKYQGRIFRVVDDHVQLASGLEQHVDVVLHPGAVAIAARVSDGQFLVVRQYRHAVEHEVLEFPAGRLEDGEDPLEAARRELAEETGYGASQWSPLGDVLVAPGWTTERIQLFLAEGLERLANPPPADADEEIEVSMMSGSDLWNATRDAKTLVGLARLGFGARS